MWHRGVLVVVLLFRMQVQQKKNNYGTCELKTCCMTDNKLYSKTKSAPAGNFKKVLMYLYP